MSSTTRNNRWPVAIPRQPVKSKRSRTTFGDAYGDQHPRGLPIIDFSKLMKNRRAK